MTEGHEVTLVTVNDLSTSFTINDALKQNLMREDLKNLPVVVVSVMGASRSGKSFLLNYFLRYLSSSPSARENGSWLDVNSNEPLNGFNWNRKSSNNSLGITIWSEPFVTMLATGETVAVFLMDTQTSQSSSVRSSSIIYALSSLVSSLQIYNVTSTITEDDLTFLDFYVNYGQSVKKEYHETASQALQFLVRDWMNDVEYSYGEDQSYLATMLKVSKDMPQEMKKLRQNICDSFEKITCFLMPHPGLKLLKTKRTGSARELDEDFLKSLKELASSIFSPERLAKKLIGGKSLRCADLLTCLQTYKYIFDMHMIVWGFIVTPDRLFIASSEARLVMAYQVAKKQFHNNMILICRERGITEEGVDRQLSREVAAARATFKTMKFLSNKKTIDERVEWLSARLRDSRAKYIDILKSSK